METAYSDQFGPPRDEQGRFTSTSTEAAPPAPLPAEAAPPRHDPYFVGLAEDFGIPKSEIDSCTPDALKAVIRREQRSQRAERDRLRSETPRDPPRTPGPQPAKTPEFDLDLGEDQYDPKIAGLAKALQHALSEIESLRGDVGGVKGYVEGQVQLTNRQQADRFFAKNEARYGRGAREDLADDSPHLQRRMALLNVAATIARNGESHAQAMARAEKVVYGDSAAPKPNDEPTPRQREWEEAGVARPTQRTPGEEPKGVRRAKRVLAEIQNESYRANGSQEHSELPD